MEMLEEEQETRSAEKLAKMWRKMYVAKSELTRKYEREVEEIEKDMKQVENELLELCKGIGANSINTEHGTIVRSVKERFSCNDWHEFYKFVHENAAPELLQKRISETNMRMFLEDNPDLHPPGLDVYREFVVTVRKPK